MKCLVTWLTAALLTSSAAIAAPDAAPAPAQAAAVESQNVPHARPSEERIGLARNFLALTQSQEENLERMREMSLQAASWPVDETSSASDRAFAARFSDRLITTAAPIIRAHMLSINEVTAVAYAREFSSEELQEMIAFAGTAAGKRYFARADFVDMDPNIIAQVMLMQEAMRPVMIEVRKEMCQEAADKRIAAGDTKAKCPLARLDETGQG